MADPKFLILGAGGQLGCEWVRHLTELDLDFLATSYPALDITDEKAVRKTIDEFAPDYVINCAAYTQVDKAEDETEKADLINYHAAAKLAEICRDSGSRLIHFSTDYVFGGKAEDQKKWPDGYPEDAAIDPINAYGMSKWKGEDAVKKTTPDHLICRVSWLCGSEGHNFVRTMLRLGREKKPIRVVNDQLGSPTFTKDVVDAVMRLLKSGAKGTYHVTCSGIMSWYDFAVLIFKHAGIDADLTAIPSEQFPTKAKRPAYSKLSTQKYEKDCGGVTYDPDISLTEMLKSMHF